MTTNHIKAILTSLRAMVIKMLPAYKFYLGSTTETTTTQICHGVMSVEDGQTQGDGDLTLDDASFAGFVEGETYTVAVNGVSGEYVAKPVDGISGVTNVADVENPPEDSWVAGYERGMCFYMVAGSYANAAISISQTKTVTTKKYQTKKLDKSLLPNGIERRIDTANKTATNALYAAQTAQTTANAAQTTANAAQTTAQTAQTTAKAAAPKSNPEFSGSFSQNRMEDTVVGDASHAEGYLTTASGNASHAEGYRTTASGNYSHAEGYFTTASGNASHAEGSNTKASGNYSHAEGYLTTASGAVSRAEGQSTKASGDTSHAEGYLTTASGDYSHAEGYRTTASGNYSHAEGYFTTASGDTSHAQGKFNIDDTAGKYVHIVGNGESSTGRSNAHTLDWNGVPWYKGRPQFGGTAQDNGAQTVVGNGDKEIILASSTSGSTKKFKITVDDTGTLTATEVTSA